MQKFNIKIRNSKFKGFFNISYEDIDKMELMPITESSLILKVGENMKILEYKNFNQVKNQDFLIYAKSNLQKRLTDCIVLKKDLSFHSWKKHMEQTFLQKGEK